jgi:hypothetical protein
MRYHLFWVLCLVANFSLLGQGYEKEPLVVEQVVLGSGITPATDLIATSDPMFSYPYKSSKCLLILEINDDTTYNYPSKFSCEVVVRCTLMNNYLYAPITVEKRLEVVYDSTKQTDKRKVYFEIESNNFVLTSILNVTHVINGVTQTDSLPPIFRLRQRLEVVRDNEYDCNDNDSYMLSSTPDPTRNELIVSFAKPVNTDEVDIEWTFIDEFSNLSSFAYNNEFFRNNATRVTVSENSYSIPLLYEKGIIVYRIRPIKYDLASGARIEGLWTTEQSSTPFLYAYSGHEKDVNWQSSTTFAEDGKRKSVVSYFDGNGKNRQTVTKTNTEDIAIIAQNIYDQEGRVAASVLPSPTLDKAIRYFENFNQNTAGDPYSFNDLALNGGCNTAFGIMASDSGASRYYSNENLEKDADIHQYIPDAEKYPFTQTEYTPDNTGRVSRTGGPGDILRIGGGHTTQHLYGTPTQSELNRLFGDEVGFESHYFKNAVVDPNGQVSVSYLDMHGRTIATALSGVADTSNITTLPEFRPDTILYLYDALIDTTNQRIDGTSIIYSKKIVVTAKGDHTFYYTLFPEEYQFQTCDSSTFCYDCIYDYKLTITNDCSTNPLYTSTKNNFSIGENAATYFDTLCESGMHPIIDSVSAFLEVGTYTVTKTLTINSDAVDFYYNSYLRNDTCVKDFTDFLDEELAKVGGADCPINCAACLEALGDSATYVANFLADIEAELEEAPSRYDTLNAIGAFRNLHETCMMLCDSINYCQQKYMQLLYDVSPTGGQYATYQFDSVNNTQYASADLASIFSSTTFLQLVIPVIMLPNSQAPVYKFPTEPYKDELGNIDSVNIDGVMTAPKDLNIKDFVAYWKPSWAKSLVKYHPEYCMYELCIENSASHDYDNYLLTIDDYDSAMVHGLFNPTGVLPSSMSGLSLPSTIDPFYTSLTSDVSSFPNKTWFNAYLHNYPSNPIANVWDLAAIAGGCNSFSNCSECDKNAMWRAFRSLYLTAKRESYEILMRETECYQHSPVYATYGAVPLLNYILHRDVFKNKQQRFEFIRNAGLDDELYDGSGNINTSSIENRRDELYAGLKTSQCEDYASYWWAQINRCTNNPSDSALIISAMVEICKLGQDPEHPWGASSSPAGTFIVRDNDSLNSFKDVLAHYSTSGRYETDSCSHYLISMPFPYITAPYNRTPLYSERVITANPGSCVCNKLEEKWSLYNASYQSIYPTFSLYLKVVEGININQRDLDELDMVCSDTTCKNIPHPFNMPYQLECLSCATCTELKSGYQAFMHRFPNANNSTSYNNLFMNFMNDRFNMNLTAIEYFTFLIDSCQDSTIVFMGDTQARTANYVPEGNSNNSTKPDARNDHWAVNPQFGCTDTICVLNNDLNTSGVTLQIIQQSVNGTAVLANNCIAYTPTDTVAPTGTTNSPPAIPPHISDSVKYSICDVSNKCDTAYLIVKRFSTPCVPNTIVAQNDTVTICRNNTGSVIIEPLLNDPGATFIGNLSAPLFGSVSYTDTFQTKIFYSAYSLGVDYINYFSCNSSDCYSAQIIINIENCATPQLLIQNNIKSNTVASFDLRSLSLFAKAKSTINNLQKQSLNTTSSFSKRSAMNLSDMFKFPQKKSSSFATASASVTNHKRVAFSSLLKRANGVGESNESILSHREVSTSPVVLNRADFASRYKEAKVGLYKFITPVKEQTPINNLKKIVPRESLLSSLASMNSSKVSVVSPFKPIHALDIVSGKASNSFSKQLLTSSEVSSHRKNLSEVRPLAEMLGESYQSSKKNNRLLASLTNAEAKSKHIDDKQQSDTPKLDLHALAQAFKGHIAGEAKAKNRFESLGLLGNADNRDSFRFGNESLGNKNVFDFNKRSTGSSIKNDRTKRAAIAHLVAKIQVPIIRNFNKAKGKLEFNTKSFLAKKFSQINEESNGHTEIFAARIGQPIDSAYCDTLSYLLDEYDSWIQDNPYDAPKYSLTNIFQDYFGYGYEYYDSLSNFHYIDFDFNYWMGELDSCGYCPEIVPCDLLNSAVNRFYQQSGQNQDSAVSMLALSAYLNNGSIIFSDYGSMNYNFSIDEWKQIFKCCNINITEKVLANYCDTLQSLLLSYDIHRSINPWSDPKDVLQSIFGNTLGWEHYDENENYFYHDFAYWMNQLNNCGLCFKPIKCSVLNSAVNKFYQHSGLSLGSPVSMLALSVYLNQGGVVMNPYGSMGYDFTESEWQQILSCCNIPIDELYLSSYCDTMQSLLQVFNGINMQNQGNDPKWYLTNTFNQVFGEGHTESCTTYYSGCSTYVQHDFIYWMNELDSCGFCPEIVSCSMLNTAISKFYQQFGQDSVNSFVLTLYLNNGGVIQPGYGSLWYSFSIEEWNRIFHCCSIDVNIDTVASHCDTIQEVLSVFEMFSNRDNWVYSTDLLRNLFYDIYGWGHYDSLFNYVGHDLTYISAAMDSSCNLSILDLYCDIIDTALQDFYNNFPMYSGQPLPISLFTDYFNLEYKGWYNPSEIATILKWCNDSLPIDSISDSNCSTLIQSNLPLVLIGQYYNEINSCIPYNTYSVLSEYYLGMPLVQGFCDSLSACGISCPPECDPPSDFCDSVNLAFELEEALINIGYTSKYENELLKYYFGGGSKYYYYLDDADVMQCLPVDSCQDIADLHDMFSVVQNQNGCVPEWFVVNLVNDLEDSAAFNFSIDSILSVFASCGYDSIHICTETPANHCDSLYQMLEVFDALQYANLNISFDSLVEILYRFEFAEEKMFNEIVLEYFLCDNQCDSDGVFTFFNQVFTLIENQNNGCVPKWFVDNYFNAYFDFENPFTLNQICTAFSGCDFPCPTICDSLIATKCDSIHEFFNIYNLLLSNAVVDSADTSILSFLFQIRFGKYYSYDSIMILKVSCDPQPTRCDTINLAMEQYQEEILVNPMDSNVIAWALLDAFNLHDSILESNFNTTAGYLDYLYTICNLDTCNDLSIALDQLSALEVYMEECLTPWLVTAALGAYLPNYNINSYSDVCALTSQCGLPCPDTCNRVFNTHCDSMYYIRYVYQQILANDTNYAYGSSSSGLFIGVYNAMMGTSYDEENMPNDSCFDCRLNDLVGIGFVSQFNKIYPNGTPEYVFTSFMNAIGDTINLHGNHVYWCMLLNDCEISCPDSLTDLSTSCDSLIAITDFINILFEIRQVSSGYIYSAEDSINFLVDGINTITNNSFTQYQLDSALFSCKGPGCENIGKENYIIEVLQELYPDGIPEIVFESVYNATFGDSLPLNFGNEQWCYWLANCGISCPDTLIPSQTGCDSIMILIETAIRHYSIYESPYAYSEEDSINLVIGTLNWLSGRQFSQAQVDSIIRACSTDCILPWDSSEVYVNQILDIMNSAFPNGIPEVVFVNTFNVVGVDYGFQGDYDQWCTWFANCNIACPDSIVPAYTACDSFIHLLEFSRAIFKDEYQYDGGTYTLEDSIAEVVNIYYLLSGDSLSGEQLDSIFLACKNCILPWGYANVEAQEFLDYLYSIISLNSGGVISNVAFEGLFNSGFDEQFNGDYNQWCEWFSNCGYSCPDTIIYAQNACDSILMTLNFAKSIFTNNYASSYEEYTAQDSIDIIVDIYNQISGHNYTQYQIDSLVELCNSNNCLILTEEIGVEELMPLLDSFYPDGIPQIVFTSLLNALGYDLQGDYDQWCTWFTNCGYSCPDSVIQASNHCDSIIMIYELGKKFFSFNQAGQNNLYNMQDSIDDVVLFYNQLSNTSYTRAQLDSLLMSCDQEIYCDRMAELNYRIHVQFIPGHQCKTTDEIRTRYFWYLNDFQIPIPDPIPSPQQAYSTVCSLLAICDYPCPDTCAPNVAEKCDSVSVLANYLGISHTPLNIVIEGGDNPPPPPPSPSEHCLPIEVIKQKYIDYLNAFNLPVPELTAEEAHNIVCSLLVYCGYPCPEPCINETGEPRLCNRPISIPMVIDTGLCDSIDFEYAYHNAAALYEDYIKNLKQDFVNNYIEKCLGAYRNETLDMKHPNGDFHFTLYYYDQAGNLVKTIPPAGFDYTWQANHTKPTLYRYNTLNQMIEQKTPDAGKSKFWYDRIGKLIFSINAEQRSKGWLSYTRYDALQRIIEVGQQEDNVINDAALDAVCVYTFGDWYESVTAMPHADKHQITRTYYDYSARNIPGLTQHNLRNRVAHTVYADDWFDELDSIHTRSASHFSYDIHGNVDELIQENTHLHPIGHGYKKLQYSYDLISGKVNRFAYQAGKPDQFHHRYNYDADNRLTSVYTSPDNNLWEEDAHYRYYKHGPLARVKIGDKDVQGIDYAYTINGWLKGVNGVSLNPDRDMGKDGQMISGNLNALTGRDLGAFALGYFDGDYQQICTTNLGFLTSGNSFSPKQLFNGNIGSIEQNIAAIGTPHTTLYGYDQLNRLLTADKYDNLDAVDNKWTSSTPLTAYHEAFTYDPDGNIQTLKRNGTNTTLDMDDLTYHYQSGNNKLTHVTDAVASGNYSVDIDNQSSNNYIYDNIGNLVQDNSEHITIDWNVYGKIREISKNIGSLATIEQDYKLIYSYAPDGNRIQKSHITYKQEVSGSTINTEADTLHTYYVRDASGNVLSTYSWHGIDTMKLRDVSLYGSSRLGLWNADNVLYIDTITHQSEIDDQNSMANVQDEGVVGVATGSKQYEFTNHLGNVLATFSDRKVPVGSPFDHFEAETRTANEYYGFGMLMPERSIASGDYRFGFNGHENDDEIAGVGNHYEFGGFGLDVRLGRRWNVDPEISVMPSLSSYSVFKNNPIFYIDPSGRIPYPITIRAFAPFKTFGFGFHGDDRGYTTGDATARVHQKINFDTDKTQIKTTAWSSPTWKANNPSNHKTATPKVQFDGDFTINNSGDNKTFGFGTHVAAANPLTPRGTPDIDVFSNFSITENKKAGLLNISGKLTGDNFPSTEAFISDPSGQNVFIGVGQIDKGVDKDWGVGHLFGEDKDNKITDFNFSITTDKKGNFTGVKQGDKTYSIGDWNKQFTDKPTQKTE